MMQIFMFMHMQLDCIKKIKENGGLTGCPANAVEKIIEECHFISRYQGGDGAVREFIEWLIARRGAKKYRV